MSGSISQVCIHNHTTEWFNVGHGVRQGDTLSPTLFCSFINDLVKELNDLKKGKKLQAGPLVQLLTVDIKPIQNYMNQESCL